jgi:hypothetical protein
MPVRASLFFCLFRASTANCRKGNWTTAGKAAADGSKQLLPPVVAISLPWIIPGAMRRVMCFSYSGCVGVIYS